MYSELFLKDVFYYEAFKFVINGLNFVASAFV
jgi:hypothetical protein